MSERYRKGAHAVHDVKYHFVWKTKYSYAVLKREVALRTRQIIREICEARGLMIVSGNVRANHVHLLVSCPTDLASSKVVLYLKGKSSFRLQREFRELQKRYWGQHLWARGYFCATVGAVNEEMIRQYVENQADDEGEFRVWDLEQKTVGKELQPDFHPEQ